MESGRNFILCLNLEKLTTKLEIDKLYSESGAQFKLEAAMIGGLNDE